VLLDFNLRLGALQVSKMLLVNVTETTHHVIGSVLQETPALENLRVLLVEILGYLLNVLLRHELVALLKLIVTLL
jgi:hypothetical protein